MKTKTDPSIIHSTFVIERTYPAKPERVFDAFADSKKKQRWFVESDHNEVEHFEQDFRAGGKEQARFRFIQKGTPVTGMTCINDTVYQDIVQNRRIVLASTMNIGGRCISASLVTFEFLPAAKGTDLICTHQGAFFEGSDGPKMRQEGWETLLDQLSKEFAA
ncbi:MAG TPA: SRPBCC family protein [Bryobacteraceae bacterium]|nr:SRPBCC family protein [Bryobacteraceae bacterium]